MQHATQSGRRFEMEMKTRNEKQPSRKLSICDGQWALGVERWAGLGIVIVAIYLWPVTTTKASAAERQQASELKEGVGQGPTTTHLPPLTFHRPTGPGKCSWSWVSQQSEVNASAAQKFKVNAAAMAAAAATAALTACILQK